MKKNNHLTEFIKKFISNKQHLALLIIYLVSALLYTCLVIWGPGPTAGDTDSNVEASYTLFKNGIDALRTPVYPFFIKLVSLFGGYTILSKLLVIILQYIVFCISVYCFYIVSKFFVASPKITYLLVFLYACHPATLMWPKIIMTESFALTGVVFLLYFVVKYIVTKKNKFAWYINLSILILVLLRPVFMILLPLALITWILLILKNKRKELSGIISMTLVLVLVILYGFGFYKQYGVFTLSTVSDVNQYMMLRDAKLISTKEINNASLQRELTDTIKTTKDDSYYFDEYIYFYKKYDYPTTHEFVKASLKQNLTAYINYTIKRSFDESTSSNVGFWHGLISQQPLYKYLKYISLPFILLYIFMFVYLYPLFRDKKRFYISALLYVVFLGNLGTIILGAPDAWGRLIVPFIPLLLIMLGQSAEYFFAKKPQQQKLSVE